MRFPNFPNSLFKTDVEVVIHSDETSMTGKPVEILNKKCYNIFRALNTVNISARSEAGYRSRFRFWRPGVRIPSGGPKKK